MIAWTVRARRWARGWELHIGGLGVTQSRSLDGADLMIRDYVEIMTGRDASEDVITILPEVGGGLDAAAQSAREAVFAAARAQRDAAAQSRAVTRDLRDAGLTGRDAAFILGITPGRVSQLLKDTAEN